MRKIFLFLCAVFLSSISLNAATITSDGTARLYFNMSAVSWWTAGTNGDGNFAYFYGSSGNKWSAHSVKHSGNDYYVVIPAGTWDHVILTRNNTKTSPSWDNKWNQTGNITLSSSSNYLSKFSADSESVTWGTAIKPTSTASVASSAASVFVGVPANLTASLTSNTDINTIKSVEYSTTTGASITGNTFTATAEGTYTVTATVTYHPNGYPSLTSTATATTTITAAVPAEEVHDVTVSYICGGEGIADATTVLSVGVETSVKVTAPEIAKYTFANWTLGADVATTDALTSNEIKITTKAGGSDFTLVANYEKAKLTYTVTVPAGTENCYLVGAMNGWDVANPIEMTKQGENVFTVTLEDVEKTDEYKYISQKGSWDYADVQEANRTWNANDVVTAWKDPLATGLYLRGTMNEWGTIDQFKKEAADAATAIVIVELKANTTYDFKVANADWSEGYSSTTEFTATSTQTLSTDVQDNAKLTTVAEGDYTFTWDLTTKKLTVTYPELPKYTITATAENGTIEGIENEGVYTQGDEVTLTATAAEGYHFVKWDDESTENPRIITVTENVTLQAIFEINNYTITASTTREKLTQTIAIDGDNADWANIPMLSEPGVGPMVKMIVPQEGATLPEGAAYALMIAGDEEHVKTGYPKIFTDADKDNTTPSAAWFSPNMGFDYELATWSTGSQYAANTAGTIREMCIMQAAYNKDGFGFDGSVWGVLYFSTPSDYFIPAATTSSWKSTYRPFIVEPTQYVYNPLAGTHAAADVYATHAALPKGESFKMFNNSGDTAFWAAWTVELSQPAIYNVATSWTTDNGSSVDLYLIDAKTNTIVATFEGGWNSTATGVEEYGKWDLTNVPAGKYVLKMKNHVSWSNMVFNAVTLTPQDDVVIANTVTGSGNYNHGAEVTLTATPATGYEFVEWSDGETANPYTFTASEEVNLTATFQKKSYTVTIVKEATNQTIAIDGNNSDWAKIPMLSEPGVSPMVKMIVPQEGVSLPDGAAFALMVQGEEVYTNGNYPKTYVDADHNKETALWSSSHYSPNFGMDYEMATWSSDSKYAQNDELKVTEMCIMQVAYDKDGFGFDGNLSAVLKYKINENDYFIPNGYKSEWESTYRPFIVEPTQYVYNPLAGTHAAKDAYATHVALPKGESFNMGLSGTSYDTAFWAGWTVNLTQPVIYNVSMNMVSSGSSNMHLHLVDVATNQTVAHFISDKVYPDGETACGTWDLTAVPAGKYILKLKNQKPWSDVVFTSVTLTPQESNVEIESAEHILTGDGTYLYGEVATLNATPAIGYNFVNWSNGKTANPYSFIVTEDVEIAANFQKKMYTVTATAENGTVTGLVEGGKYEHGATATLTATANEHYVFVNWTKGEEVVAETAEYTFTVEADVELVANFKLDSHTVAATAVNGTVTGAGTYNHGEEVTLTATPAFDYQFVKWSNESTENPLTITVTDNVTLEAIFAEVAATEKTESGVFSISAHKTATFATGNLQYNVGTQTWRFAKQQYQVVGEQNINLGDPAFTGWIDMLGWSNGEANNYGVNPSNVNELYDGEFVDWGTKMGEGWSTLSAEEWSYLLNTRENAASLKQIAKVDTILGILLFPDNWTLPEGCVPTSELNHDPEDGEETKYDFTSQNYALEQWTKLEQAGAIFLPAAGRRTGGYGNMINYDQVEETDENKLNGGFYRHQDNTNIYCYYWTSTINEDKNVSYLHNVLALGNDEYTIGNGAIWGEKGRYGQSVRLAKVAYDKHEVTVTSENGTITGAGEYTHGDIVTLTATPAEHYVFVNWAAGETVLSTENPYIFTLEADVELKANFALDTHTITATAENGTVEGAGEYTHGTEVTLTATPADGYEFVNWTAGKDTVSTEATYTFTVEADLNLVANFQEVITYTVKWYTAVGKTTEVTLEEGAAITKPATNPKKEGYVFMGWTDECFVAEDGNDFTAIEEFGTADADKEYYAVFAIETTTGGGGDEIIEKSYTFSGYTAGTQYAENETHQLDNDVTIYTTQCHFTTQLRIYSSSTHDGYVISNQLPGNIISMSFNMGNKIDNLAVYGSTDGSTWTEVGKVATTSESYKDYEISFGSTNYTYFKLDVAGSNQIRIAKMGIIYATAVSGEPTTTYSNYMTTCTPEEYTIEWSVNGKVAYTTTVVEGEALVLPPEEPEVCSGKVFMGWATTATVNAYGSAITWVDETVIPESDKNYYAVFATEIKEETNETYTKTATVNIAEYAAANNWVNETKYENVIIDQNITATATSTGSNTGKYYVNGNNWRLYQSDKDATLTIGAAEGVTINNVTVTYDSNNSGVLTSNSSNIISGTTVKVNASSVTFGVGQSTSNGKDNGQVRVTQISVNYTFSGTITSTTYADYSTICVIPEYTVTFDYSVDAGYITVNDVRISEKEVTYEEGTVLTVKALTFNNYRFDAWTDEEGNELTTEPEYTFTVTGDVVLKASITYIPGAVGTGVENNNVVSSKTMKVIQNGRLMIIREGKTYNAQGQMIE